MTHRRFLLVALWLSPAAPLAAQANPVNLYAVELRWQGDVLTLGTPRKLTGDRGRNSQPAFTPDGRAIVFSAVRDSSGQGDIYRIDLASGAESQITRTPENENSPTATASGEYLAIRWVPSTLFREWGLWVYGPDGTPRRGVLPGPDTVGYYVAADERTYALMRPATRFSVALYDTASRTTTDVDWPAAPLPPQRIPGAHAVSFTRTDSSGHHQIRRIDLATRALSPVVPSLPGRTVHTWARAGALLMARGNGVYLATPGGTPGWRRVAGYEAPDLQDLAAYAVSPDGRTLILISPLRPPLHTALRDTLEAGTAPDQVASWLRSLRSAGRLAEMFVSEAQVIGASGRHAAVLEAVVELFPDSYRAWSALGAAAGAAGDPARARTAYQRSLDLNPRTTDQDRDAATRTEAALRALPPPD